MKKTTYLLSLSTAFFASTTAYLLADRWSDRRPARPLADGLVTSNDAQVSISASPADAKTSFGQAAVRSGADPGLGTAAAPGSVENQPVSAEPAADVATAYARQFLARHDDSVKHAALLDEARASVRRQYSRLKEILGLGDAKFEQLVTLLAEQNLQAQERWARCATTPGCETRNGAGIKPPEDRSQEILALLGDTATASFTKYRDSLFERDSVAQFRGRLSDAAFLPEAQTEQLIAALAEERTRYSDEVTQAGGRVTGWGTNLGTVWYPDGIGPVEQQLAEAAQFSQRMRTRAAAVLTPAQFAAFVQMQEELLAQLAAYLQPAQRKSSPPRLALRN